MKNTAALAALVAMAGNFLEYQDRRYEPIAVFRMGKFVKRSPDFHLGERPITKKDGYRVHRLGTHFIKVKTDA